MGESQSRLAVELQASADVDAEELAQLAWGLREELLDLDVDAVEPQGDGSAPADAKGVGLIAFGGLVVRFILTRPVLESVVAGVRSWVARQHIRSVKLTLDGDTLEVTGLSSAEQDRLVDLWIVRHASAH